MTPQELMNHGNCLIAAYLEHMIEGDGSQEETKLAEIGDVFRQLAKPDIPDAEKDEMVQDIIKMLKERVRQ